MSMWLVNTEPIFAAAFAPDGTQGDVGTDVTVTVTRADGTVLVTDASTTKSGSGTSTEYQWTFDVASNTRVDALTLVWTDASTGEQITTTEEIVGNLLFSTAEAQTFGDGKLANTSGDDIVAARDRITELFEDYTGVGFVSRYARGRFSGPSHRDPYRVWLFNAQLDYGGKGATSDILEVISADDGTAVSTANIHIESGAIRRDDAVWTYRQDNDPYPITIDWKYGLRTVPLDIRQAALALARYELVHTDVTDRMIAFTDPNIGTIRLSTPGPNHPTGIPIVDQTLNRYRLPVSVA